MRESRYFRVLSALVIVLFANSALAVPGMESAAGMIGGGQRFALDQDGNIIKLTTPSAAPPSTAGAPAAAPPTRTAVRYGMDQNGALHAIPAEAVSPVAATVVRPLPPRTVATAASAARATHQIPAAPRIAKTVPPAPASAPAKSVAAQPVPSVAKAAPAVSPARTASVPPAPQTAKVVTSAPAKSATTTIAARPTPVAAPASPVATAASVVSPARTANQPPAAPQVAKVAAPVIAPASAKPVPVPPVAKAAPAVPPAPTATPAAPAPSVTRATAAESGFFKGLFRTVASFFAGMTRSARALETKPGAATAAASVNPSSRNPEAGRPAAPAQNSTPSPARSATNPQVPAPANAATAATTPAALLSSDRQPGPSTVSGAPHFSLLINSLAVRRTAEKVLEELADNGIAVVDSKSEPATVEVYRLMVGRFDNRDDAQECLRTVLPKIKGAYIISRDNDHGVYCGSWYKLATVVAKHAEYGEKGIPLTIRREVVAVTRTTILTGAFVSRDAARDFSRRLGLFGIPAVIVTESEALASLRGRPREKA